MCIFINRGGLKGKSKKLPKGTEAKGIQQNAKISGNISLRGGEEKEKLSALSVSSQSTSTSGAHISPP